MREHRQKTRKVTVPADTGELLDIMVPTDLWQPPLKDMELAQSMMDKANWKMRTARVIVESEKRAHEIGKALEWYLGGYSVEQAGPKQWAVWSEGYYHHVGA